MGKETEGIDFEVEWTKRLNLNKSLWNVFPFDFNNKYAIHVISNKYGKINQALIYPKADIFIAEGEIDKKYIDSKKGYLDECDYVNFKLNAINNTGISVKLVNSRYTIIKMCPNTFKKIFKSNILAVGASIYSTKQFEKNIDILKGWDVTEKEFYDFYSTKLSIDINSLSNKDIMSKIKTYSNEAISRIIKNDQNISNFIFKGIGNFDEPYTASWIIENDKIKSNYFIPFKVTTGSGRSKGIYTIVLKPISTQ